MHRLLRADPGSCTACGTALGPGAAWCGGCGAHVADRPSGELTAVADAAPGSARPPTRRRVVGSTLVVVALVGLLVAGATRPPPPVALLGTPDGVAGQTASGPPPAGLRLAWSQRVVDPGEPGRVDPSASSVLVRGDRVVVDGRVVDVPSGGLAAALPAGTVVGRDGTGVLVQGRELVLLDAFRGTVRGRTPLPGGVGPGLAAVGRTDGVSVLVDARSDETLLLRDDGTLVGRHPGRAVVRASGGADATAAVAVRQQVGLVATTRLVATDDGRVLATQPPGEPQVVDVVGDRALAVVARSADVGSPGAGAVWGVWLLDATDGSTVARRQMTSAVTPRLLGDLGDGRVAVATWSGREVTVWRIDPVGEDITALAQVRSDVLPLGPAIGEAALTGSRRLLTTAAVAGAVTVVHDELAARVTAVDAEGVEVWSRTAPGTVGLGVGSGVVALHPDDPDRATRVLDAATGREVVGVPSLAALTPTGHAPVAVLDGHVALAPPMEVLDLAITTATWVDVTTGARRSAADVLAGAAGVTDRVTGRWRLLGVTRALTSGRLEPVVLRDLGRDRVQVLVAGDGFRAVPLDVPAAGDVAGFLPVVVGADERYLALWHDSFDGPAASTTHVVDRTTGAVARFAGVQGIALRRGLLLAVDRSDAAAVTLVGLDPATGDVRWRRDAFGDRSRQWSDHALLLGATPVGLAAVGLDDGATRWRYDAGTALVEPVVLGPAHVVVATVTGEVVALDRGDGRELWRVVPGGVVTALSGAGDATLVGTATGLVVHLDATGREVQRLVVGSGPVVSVAALGDTVVAVADGAAVGLRADGTGVVRRDEVDLPPRGD